MIDKDKREVGGWWMWVLFLIVISGIVFGGLRYAGLVGQTFVERKVFENSYQYSAAQKARIATFQAQLSEIDTRLMSTDLDDATRANLEATRSGIKIQLTTARNLQ
jgi:biopolymer transport protein ExbB/TolQ